MPLIVWELDEIAEAILGIYGAIIGLIILLVILERDPTTVYAGEYHAQPAPSPPQEAHPEASDRQEYPGGDRPTGEPQTLRHSVQPLADAGPQPPDGQ